MVAKQIQMFQNWLWSLKRAYEEQERRNRPDEAGLFDVEKLIQWKNDSIFWK